jgi:signal transduction histidine kinase
MGPVLEENKFHHREKNQFGNGDETLVNEMLPANGQLLQQVRDWAALGERNRLAQDLHDNVAQVLGYLNVQLATTSTLLDNGNEILIHIHRQANELHISVEDSGRGFDLAEIDQTAQTGKSGLGLEIMGERAESIGGNVQIKSALGKGTKIDLWIPITLAIT